MKHCPFCNKEMSAETTFCPNCGKSLNGSSDALNLPKIFLRTFIGAIGILIFSLFDWLSVDLFFTEAGGNLFGLSSYLIKLDRLAGSSQEFKIIEVVIISLAILLLLSFALLLISLIKHKSKQQVVFAQYGFGLSGIVSFVFILIIMYFNFQKATLFSGLTVFQMATSLFSGLTVFPFLTFAVAIIESGFLKRMLYHSAEGLPNG